MPVVYIGLGSNKGDRLKNIKVALDHLKEKIAVEKISSFYLTEPVGMEGRWFVNCVLEGKTEQSPEKLLDTLLQIEKRMGRIREKKKNPRVIDLDLLLYEDAVVDKVDLIVPHPHLHKRRFALIPLVEINSHLVHPVLGKSLKEILKGLKDSHQVDKILENGYAGH
ncbi:2-amino-4-hydroxy-6-hydroxymethyldihydropteridine diphosphokinase [Candidatus Aerophobetes bacterium Ae_b3b]|nr:MAG: 2-amino-4-hydroxy-6-hydroxymethyldihydropteridine diphosphokinase [Candidatus Aerophobetes bacterium Ae_b3b]